MNETPKWFKATVAQAKDFFKKDQLVKQGINNVDGGIVMEQENYTCADWEEYVRTFRKNPEEAAPPTETEWEAYDDERIDHLRKMMKEPVVNTDPVQHCTNKSDGWKPSNPKDLMGIRKVSLCAVSGPVLYEVALGMQEGGMKYGRHNYRSEGVAASTYTDAGMRHLWEYWEGEDIDPESGVHHISKAISTLFVLRDAILNGKCTDDRPIRPGNPEWLKEMNAQASALVDKYPQPEKPYTHKPLPER